MLYIVPGFSLSGHSLDGATVGVTTTGESDFCAAVARWNLETIVNGRR